MVRPGSPAYWAIIGSSVAIVTVLLLILFIRLISPNSGVEYKVICDEAPREELVELMSTCLVEFGVPSTCLHSTEQLLCPTYKVEYRTVCNRDVVCNKVYTETRLFNE